MRKVIMAGLTAALIGGLAAGITTSQASAQSAADAPAAEAPPPAAPRPPMPPGEAMPPWMRWMHGGPHGPMGEPMRGMMGHRTFALFYHPDDRKLSTADVQKIAEAFLLWNGNRDWKVTQVAPAGDSLIGFAFATSDGGVIARFTMDSRTGRIARVG